MTYCHKMSVFFIILHYLILNHMSLEIFKDKKIDEKAGEIWIFNKNI